MNILDLVTLTGAKPRKMSGTKGGEYHSPCPACGGEDRFHIWPEQNNGQGSWWCRGCEAGGDMISYLRQIEGKSFREAAKIAGKELPEGGYRKPVQVPGIRHATRTTRSDLEASRVKDPAQAWQEKSRALVDYAAGQLMSASEPLEWLSARGFKKRTAQRFNLGWIPEKTFRPRASWGLPEEMSEKTGKPKLLWIPRGLVIPCYRAGHVVRIRIRRPEPDAEPRYYMMPGSATDPSPMFVAESTWTGRSQCLVVCESELDAMLMAQEAGDLVQTMAVGSSSAKPRDELAASVCSRAARILLALDADEAGEKACSWWLENYPSARRMNLPQGCKDPGDMFKAGHDIREWVSASLPNLWRIGMSASGMQEKGAAGAGAEQGVGEQVEDRPNVQSIPAAVKRMYDLLQHADVMLVCTPQRSAIKPLHQVNGKWVDHHLWWHTHREQAREIHDLFWYNDQVLEYLRSHPDEKITRKNYWKPFEREEK